MVGLHSRYAPDNYSESFEVAEVIPHEEFDRKSNGAPTSDIMLIKLAEPVQFNEAVSPVCLPEPGEEFGEGMMCYTSGWGRTSCEIDLMVYNDLNILLQHFPDGGHAPDDLQQVMLPIVSNEDCNKTESYEGYIDESMMCAGYQEGGRGSCHVGDLLSSASSSHIHSSSG